MNTELTKGAKMSLMAQGCEVNLAPHWNTNESLKMMEIQNPPTLQTISKVLARSSLSSKVATDINVHPSVTN